MFLRVTNAVSRQQEFTADQLAARTVGARATLAGLQKVHKYGLAFDAYFRQEYIPVIESGYKPPRLGGFALFLKAPQIQEAVNNYYDEQATQGQSDPYDTHPSLKERIAALQHLPEGGALNDCEALSLLPADVQRLESLVLKEMMTREEDFTKLQEISWDNVAEYAFLPRWRKGVETYRPILKDLTAGMLFETTQDIPSLFAQIAQTGDLLAENVRPEQVPQETQVQFTGNLLGSALAAMLHHAGWMIKTSPGEEIVFVKGTKELKPFSLSSELVSHRISAEQWQALCIENQIANLALA
jgi:hypothetical protein